MIHVIRVDPYKGYLLSCVHGTSMTTTPAMVMVE